MEDVILNVLVALPVLLRAAALLIVLVVLSVLLSAKPCTRNAEFAWQRHDTTTGNIAQQ